MTNAALVMVGGAIGSLVRYLISVWWIAFWGEEFPWATLMVNAAGSFGIGLFAGLTLAGGLLPVPLGVRIFVMVGLFGGFTTFSAFSLQTLQLAQDGRLPWAVGNIAGSIGGCLLAVWLGHSAGIWLNSLAAK